MSTKADYSPEEWQLLLDVPPAVGTAVMHAGRSGMGTVKESLAMVNSILRADNHYEENKLVGSLVDARLKNGEKSEIETLNSPYAGRRPDEILQDAVQRCQRVLRVLENRATSEEAVGYIDWAISVGEKVAAAAKEGSFLGIGGKRVSQEEEGAIAAIRQAMGR